MSVCIKFPPCSFVSLAGCLSLSLFLSPILDRQRMIDLSCSIYELRKEREIMQGEGEGEEEEEKV